MKQNLQKMNSSEEVEVSGKILSNLSEQFFTGRNEEILNQFMAELSFQNLNELLGTVFKFIDGRIDVKDISDIEELDLISLAKELAESIQYNKQFDITETERTKFEKSLKDFSHAALHDVAFPIMVMENPNLATSAKNMIKRVVSSMQTEENIDMSEVYSELDIENLPTEFSMNMFLRLGGTIPGLESETELSEAELVAPPILFCELTIEQAIYLSYILKEDYDTIKSWKILFQLLKSNGKKYESLVVNNEKKGILLSVLDILYEKRTITDVRFLRTNKGNGIWRFFQGYLINSKDDKPYSRELRKIRNENPCEEEAIKIVNEIFEASNQHKIIIRAKEILENDNL